MYLLDSNVFIQAKNFYYGFDIAPTFWKWLDEQQKVGKIASIQPVYDELVDGDDELAEWTKERKDSQWFMGIDDESTQAALKKVAQWTMESGFKTTAKKEFLGAADSMLIAKALSSDCTIVTHESLYDPNIKRKIKIPNACEEFGIKYVSTFDLLRILGAKL